MTQREMLQLLWDKYVNDQKLTAGEIRQLRELIQDPSNHDLLTGLLNPVYDVQSEVAHAEFSSQDAFNEVWKKLGQENENTTTVIRPSFRNKWLKYAAAAVFIVAAGIGVYKLAAPSSTKQVSDVPAVATPDEAIRPGGNNALLTLADGSVVTLSSLENGLVASQGETKVLKLANGELAYEPGQVASQAAGYNTIATPRGGKYRLTLPDGSKVWLNAESSLRYPTAFTGDTREVSLTGEAYFEIAHNAKQPFRVQVRDLKVEVLGTHFDIMAYENEPAIATTLVEGSVLVSSASQQLKLKPGQQALQAGSGNMELHESPDLQQVLAWKNDYFQFNGDRLDRLMRQLERWYDVSVVFEGNVPDRKFGGKISRSSPLKDVLKVLELSDVKFRVAGKTITVTNN